MNIKLFYIPIGIMLLASCQKKQEPIHPQYVRVETPTNINERMRLSIPGKTKAAEDINLSFRVSGPIERILVKEGDFVKKGQLVAIMDPRDYEDQLRATTAEYQQIKGDAERVMALYADGGTTASNNDKAKYGLQQITSKLSHHKNQLADTKLYAPFDGYIAELMFKEHETVSAGMPIISMFSSKNTEVEIELSASDYLNKNNFEHYRCQFEVLGKQPVEMYVISTDKKANSNQLYTMRLGFTTPCPDVTPGMTAMVFINEKQDNTEKFLVPNTAVFEEKGQSSVYVLNAKGIVEKKDVKVRVLRSDGQAEITGVNENDQIITAGVHKLHEGEKATALPKVSKTNVGGLL